MFETKEFESLFDYDKEVMYEGVTYYVIELLDGYALVMKENPATAKFPVSPLVLPWPIQK